MPPLPIETKIRSVQFRKLAVVQRSVKIVRQISNGIQKVAALQFQEDRKDI